MGHAHDCLFGFFAEYDSFLDAQEADKPSFSYGAYQYAL
jgi:hypothetical protein